MTRAIHYPLPERDAALRAASALLFEHSLPVLPEALVDGDVRTPDGEQLRLAVRDGSMVLTADRVLPTGVRSTRYLDVADFVDAVHGACQQAIRDRERAVDPAAAPMVGQAPQSARSGPMYGY